MPQGFDTSTANHQVIDVKGASSAQDSKLYQGGRNHIGHQFSGYPDIQAAARRSNEVDAKPAAEFRDRPELDRDSSYTGGGDFYGDANKAGQQAIARKALKDKLPGGTDLLVDSVKASVR